MSISEQQYRLLTAFFAHCINVFHEQAEDNFGQWSEALDKASIPWRIQNSVSAIASNKASIGLYLRTHLNQKGITVNAV